METRSCDSDDERFIQKANLQFIIVTSAPLETRTSHDVTNEITSATNKISSESAS